MELTGRIFNIQKFSINDGPGIRTTVFFKGCPLQCAWCSNPESQNRFAAVADAMEDAAYCGRDATVSSVLAEVMQDKPFYDQSGGGMTLSGGEVLQQAEFAMALADAARAEGVHVAAETTGFCTQEKFEEFLTHFDLLLYDFKHADAARHRTGTGVDNAQILKNLRYAVSIRKHIIARIPVIPGFNADISDALQISAALAQIGVEEVHLLPFHQFGEKKYQQLGAEYALAKCKQLHPEDLQEYQQTFLDAGLNCAFH